MMNDVQDSSVAGAGSPARASWLTRIGWLDLTLGSAGCGLGWMSMFFPFGRDQGLYFYVAREWLHGAVPYRDVLDHKTPGIYMVHALAIALFGEKTWAIRVLELVAVVLTGLVAATFSVARGHKPAPGVRGASVLAASLFFYGFLNFWDSSQSEIWYSLLGISAVCAARRAASAERAQLLAGALSGAALVMKPPSLWFVLVALLVAVARTTEREPLGARPVALAVARFSAGGAAVVLPVLGYFGLAGALPDMVQIVVRSNARYAQLEKGAATLDDVMHRLLDFVFIYNFVAPLLAFGIVLGLGFALGRRDRVLLDRHVLAVTLGVAGLLAVIMQMKFYLLHYTALLGPATVIAANLTEDCRGMFSRARLRRLAPVLFVSTLLVCWTQTNGWTQWLDENRVIIAHLRGQISRPQFAAHFQFPGIWFWYDHSEQVGLWLRAHSRPEDTILVRGFEPQLYVIAERRYTGRHFWSMFLVSNSRGTPEELARWNEEDRATFEQQPPRFVVAMTFASQGPDSAAWFLPHGYEVREVVHEFTILERRREPEARVP